MDEFSKEQEEAEEQHPERPLECSECRKPIAVHYTQIVGESITHTGMCSDCPQLQRRLQGAPAEEEVVLNGSGGITGVICGECGSNLDNLRVAHTVGCSHCYEVFEDPILDEMVRANKISANIIKGKKTIPLHVGRAPGELLEISPSLRLIALNEALEETLQKENYEQAALLRDQIKALTDEQEDSDDEKK